jgi:colanic acid/amylovoran biosynthesis protein
MNLLITNSVPLNGGDEALLRATVESLRSRWPESNVTVLCKYARQARAQLPDLSIDSDLEFTSDNERERIQSLYRDADIVISAPGGFLHDFYPLRERLDGFEFAIGLGKPVVLFAQSIGPFWESASRRRVRDVLNRVALICVRDAASKHHLDSCGVKGVKIHETADAAFLWRYLSPELFQPKSGPLKSVALAFRIWPPGDEVEVQRTLKKAEALCKRLLTDSQRRLVFLSTCQGIDGYVDDSLLAQKIVERLPTELQNRCYIDRKRYGPRELIRAYGRCDAFIGMRLHGCILAMLAGTPAFGFGYEQKTEELFTQLGLATHQARFDANVDTWLDRTERFVQDIPKIQRQLAASLDRLAARATLNLDYLEEVVSTHSNLSPS